MSAISSFGRITAPALLPPASERLILQFLQGLERTDGVANRFGGDMRKRAVAVSLAWPRRTWITLTSVFASKRWVAKLCRNVCSVAGLAIPAMFLAAVKARLSCRGEIGLIFGLPGNSQPCAALRANTRARVRAARATA